MLNKYFYFFLFSFALLLCSAGAVRAAVLKADVPPSCDVDMMELMNINARKSGQRTMEMAQRIILKPDSVLEYTCFDKEIKKADAIMDALNTGLRSPSGGGLKWPSVADVKNVELLNLDAYGKYLDGSYGATFGGGTYVHSGAAGSAAGCAAMDLVWDFLKCENFNTSDDTSGDTKALPFFLTFKQLAGFDPRQFPLACSSSVRDNQWKQDNLDSDVSKLLVDP